jgi:hypothetical protein
LSAAHVEPQLLAPAKETRGKSKRSRKGLTKKGAASGVIKKASGSKANVNTEPEVDIFGGLL